MRVDVFGTEMCKVTFGLEYIKIPYNGGSGFGYVNIASVT